MAKKKRGKTSEKKKTLIITEKRSVAETIAKALGRPTKHKDYFEVGDYIITWAQGHLYTLAEPDTYDKKLKAWKLMFLPIIPEEFKIVPIQGTSKKRITAIKRLLKDADTVINAMDAGREGELIFRYIKRALNIKQPVKRLWLQAMTKEAILQAMENLKEEEELENLGQAAEARGEADWLVGINSTRAITIVGKELFSIGRVQTPTLAILVEREKEIQNFKPRPYWKIKATMEKAGGNFISWHIGENGDGKIWEENKAKDIYRKVEKAENGTVSEVKTSKKTKYPPLPFRLATFQRTASSLFGWTAKASLAYLQNLYEMGLITYPRTDSSYLPTDMKKEVGKIAKALVQVFPQLEVSRISSRYRSSLFDDSKVSDHFAIIPTGKKPDSLDGNLKKAYELVARRFFASFYPPAEYTLQNVSVLVKEEPFKASLSILTKRGYLAIYPYDVFSIKSSFSEDAEDKEKYASSYEKYMQKLESTPQVSKGESLNVEGVELLELETKPPTRYTDGTLIKLMETAGRDIEDEELKEAMKGKGLGTPATRAAIIETLIDRGYVERVGKALKATRKGIELIDTLRSVGLKTLTEPVLTGEWEYRLRLIEEGKKKKEEFMNEVAELTREIIDTIRNKDFDTIRNNLTAATERDSVVGKCPLCGGDVIVKATGYFCENAIKENPTCTFKMYKNTFGGTITPDMARELLSEGKTKKKVRLYSKGKKRTYYAHLVLTPEGEVVPDFIAEAKDKEKNPSQHTAVSEESLGKCPICGSDVVKTDKGYACIKALSDPPQCTFIVEENIYGGKLTDDIMRQILEKGETDEKVRLYSRGKRKPYQAKLVLTKDGKIVPDFVAKGKTVKKGGKKGKKS